MHGLVLILSIFCLCSASARSLGRDYEQVHLDINILLGDAPSDTPTATFTAADCTATNIIPTDLATYTHKIYESSSGRSYNVTNGAGLIQDTSSPYSLQGVYFGPSGPDSNSYGLCVPECADWCDSHPTCRSFNVFTFQEEDYDNCRVTCECRAVSRPFNKTTAKVDYREYDPVWPSWIYTQDAYCFNSTCCYDHSASEYDPCLWEAADIPGYIQGFYADHPKTKKGIIYDIEHSVFNFDYDCDVTQIQSCPTAFPGPNVGDPEEIRAYLSVVALRRWMLFMSAKRYFVLNAFQTLVNADVQDIVSTLTGANTKPPAIPENHYITTALGILSTMASWVVLPEEAVVTEAFENLSTLLGVGQKISDLVDRLTNTYKVQPQTELKGLPNYLINASLEFAVMIEQSAGNFTHDVSTAVKALDQMKGAALNLTSDISWTQPDLALLQTRPLMRAWTIATVFKSLGIFIHLENHVNAKWPYDGTYHYPGERIFTRPFGSLHFPTYAFPVYYVPQQNPHNTRIYGTADSLSKYGIDWQSVYLSSYNCQYFAHQFGQFGQNAYPEIDPDTLYSTILSNPSVDPSSITCMWNLPVCDSSNSNLVTQCTNNQKCCTGSILNPIQINPVDDGGWSDFGGASYDHYNNDNFALDDWCATKLGAQGLWHSGPWKKSTGDHKPFMGC